MSGIDKVAENVYNAGGDPLGFAEVLVAEMIRQHVAVMADRVDNPGVHPEYLIADGPRPIARAIIGQLLDAGWTPPTPGRSG